MRTITMIACLIAVAMIGLFGNPAHAAPRTDTVKLPDGSTVFLVSDSKFQLFAPSTTTRLAFHCWTLCERVEADTSGSAVLTGFWGAAGQALRRPDKYISTIQNGNSIASTATGGGGATATTGEVNNALANTQGDQTNAQGQLALGGAGGNVVGSGNSAIIGSGNSSALAAPIVAPVITPITTVAPTIAPVTVIENTGTQTCSGLGCSNN